MAKKQKFLDKINECIFTSNHHSPSVNLFLLFLFHKKEQSFEYWANICLSFIHPMIPLSMCLNLFRYAHCLSLQSVLGQTGEQHKLAGIVRSKASPTMLEKLPRIDSVVVKFSAPSCSYVRIWLLWGQELGKMDIQWVLSQHRGQGILGASPNWEAPQLRFGAHCLFLETPLGKWEGLREADKAQGENVPVFPESFFWSSHRTIKLLARDRKGLDK